MSGHGQRLSLVYSSASKLHDVYRIYRWTGSNCMIPWIQRAPVVELIPRRRSDRMISILSTCSGRTTKAGEWSVNIREHVCKLCLILIRLWYIFSLLSIQWLRVYSQVYLHDSYESFKLRVVWFKVSWTVIMVRVCFCSPFPTVAEAVQEELEDYKTKEDEVGRLKRAMVGSWFCCSRT